jgi:hypothetical protein
MSTPAEISAQYRSKILPPWIGSGLHFRPDRVKMNSAGEAEASSAGEQLAEE